MSSGPLPPHERPWRHPSELVGPPPPPPATRNGRLILVSTASAALLLVGVLAVTVTPSTVAHRDAAAADRTGADPTSADPTSADPTAADHVALGASHAVATPAADRAPTTELAADVRVNAYVVTPVAAGYGLTTRSALTDPAAVPRLPTGHATQLALLVEIGPVAVVSIPAHDVAPLHIGDAPDSRHLDDADHFVVVDGKTIPYAAAQPADLLEGAPVVDDRGALIGLITYTEVGPALLAVSINDGLAPPLALSTIAAPESTTDAANASTSEPAADDSVVGTALDPATTSDAATTSEPDAPTTTADAISPAATGATG